MRKMRRLLKLTWVLFNNFVLSYFTDRGRRVAFSNALLAFERQQRQPATLPSVELTQVFSGVTGLSIELAAFDYRGGSVSFGELCILASLVRFLLPRVVFEFGTGDGSATLQLALNSPVDCTVYSLDLPEGAKRTKLRMDEGDKEFVGRLSVGERYAGSSASRKIRQIRCDSADFDPSSLVGRVNIVFIDGSHSFEYVKNDTQLAFQMMAPGGVVAWHDYLVWNGVTDFLEELSKSKQLYHIRGTSLVLHRS
jgi:predicted O-methyltransferase YrrM